MKARVSPAALLFWAALIFMDDSGCFAAAVPAITVHELGHIGAIRLLGGSIQSIYLELTGLKIRYSGTFTRVQRIICHLTGPAAGAAYGLICLALGGDYMRLSGLLSLGYTVFNFLPVIPLDGGMALAAISEKAAQRCSQALSLLLFAGGVYLLSEYRLVVPVLIGVYLAAINFSSVARPAFRLRRLLRSSDLYR